MKRKMLFIYKYCNMGGVASVIKQRFCRMSDEFEFECAFIEDAGPGTREWQQYGIPATIMGKDYAGELAKMLACNNYHWVTVIDTPEVMPALKEHYKGPIIYEVHTSLFNYIYPSRNALLESDCIVVPSNWSKQVLIERIHCAPGKIHVVPNFVDEDLFTYRAPEVKPAQKIILWVGKLDNYKNWRDALAVFDMVCQRNRNVCVKMITGGLYTTPIQLEYIAELIRRDLLGKVALRHNVPYGDMGKMYCQAAASGGVLLSTSLHESFSMIVHEAWRCHLPVVASRVGPLDEMVQDGANGMLFEARDVKTAAGKIEQILKTPKLRGSLIKRGLITASHYDTIHTLPTYLNLLESQAAQEHRELAGQQASPKD